MKTDAIHLKRAQRCPNCGTAVSANYCHQCGQETVLHVPSAGEFLHEFVGHYVALEGKLWKSLGLLLFRPGRLTREYLEGRRVRYVLPLRLYLTFSIIFFALFKVGTFTGGTEVTATASTPPAAVAQQSGAAPKAGEGGDKALVRLDPDDSEIVDKLILMAPKPVQPKLARLKNLPTAELARLATSAFFSYVPYAVFALMPVFAMYLKLLYAGSGRRYGEHLLFALHTNAFAFLVLSLLMVLPDSIPFLHGLLGLWLVFYLPTAMRKVYGGSRLATFARWTVLALLHVLGRHVRPGPTIGSQ